MRKTAGPYGKKMFSFVRKHKTTFQSGLLNFAIPATMSGGTWYSASSPEFVIAMFWILAILQGV